MEKSSASSLFVFSLCCLLLTGCSHRQSVEEPAHEAAPKDKLTLSSAAVKRFDISSMVVQQKSADDTTQTTGEIKPDENRVFHINSLSNGRVINDNVMLGDVIRAGQTLAVVQNLDVAKVYGQYIHEAHQNEIDVNLAETRTNLARKNYERLRSLFADRIAAEKDLIKAEADYKIEQENLRGLKEHAIHIKAEAEAMLAAYGVKLGAIRSEHIESNSSITTPRGGVIIKKNVTVGDVVSNSEPLYVVADLSKVWLDIAVYDKQLQTIKQGDAVAFTSDSVPGHTVSGRISYMKPSTEGTTGTFIARAELDNPRMLLKPGMFGQVVVRNAQAATIPFLPDEAVQQYGKETFVFIDEGNGSYRKQLIEPLKHVNGGFLIAQGVAAGDHVVGKGSFTLKAEMLKGTMAGEE